MPDVIAIVSKAIFDKAAREQSLEPGAVWPTSSYVSQNKGLQPLAAGGRLFLVTVRPPDEALWLVGVLESPRFDGTQWKAKKNVVPVSDVSAIKSKLRFESGAGLPSKKGVLGMALQTPRVLAPTDAPLLLGGGSAKAPREEQAKKTAGARAAKANGGAKANGAAEANGAASGKGKADAADASASPVRSAAFADALRGWRSTAHPRYAAIVEALGAKEPKRPLVGAGGKKADIAAWDALEKQRDPADLARLFATLGTANSPVAATRVERLVRWNDPRVVTGLLALLEDPPYTGGSSKKLWQTVIAALQKSGDVRARDGMISLSKRYKRINDTLMGEWIAGAMARAAKTMKDEPALAASHREKLEVLEAEVLGSEVLGAAVKGKAKPSASPEEMLEQIIEAPDDDALRLVYADMLSEAGDTRGELIVLQVERAAGRGTAERADIERTKFVESGLVEEWGPPLSAALETIEWERGFPVAGRLQRQGLAQVVDAMEWGTLRTLTGIGFAPVKAVIELLDGPRAKNLVRVEALSAKLLKKLRTPTFPWRRLALVSEDLVPSTLERFPSVEDLEIIGDDPLDARLFAKARGIVALTLADPAPHHSAELFEGLSKLERLALEGEAEPERFAGLPVRHLSVRRTEFRQASRWLRALPHVTHLECQVEDLAFDDLGALLDAHPKLESVAFRRFVGIFHARVERQKTGLSLVVPPAERWSGFYDELAEIASPLRQIGVRSLVLYPEEPRHLMAPLAREVIDPVRKAWSRDGGRFELRELL